ncbi:YhgE/Pip family protein [Cnuibacter sp. UC19_7]|uniref:YhgE/Pip family protein n=1 Tax=Cnuibacter sp. UC19_7 TaxID=3350166 RepID=UPI00366C3BAD
MRGAAIAAVAVPVALWIGALVLYLVLMPFTRSALLSTASTLRVVVSALRWPLILGAGQAALVAAILLAVGVRPAHLVGSVVFTFVMAVAFVMLHQGLVALLGQGGRILSLALVVVQVVAAAVVIPAGLSSPAYTGLATVLPLSHAITGMQLLATGGSLTSVLQEALVLLVFALIGLALAIVAATRARSRDLVAETAPAPAGGDVARSATPPDAPPADGPRTPGALGGPHGTRGLTAPPPAPSGA